MKVGSIDNQLILYLEGNEDLAVLAQGLFRMSGSVPGAEAVSKELDLLNVVPTTGSYHDETASDEALVPGYETEQYRSLIAGFHRNWIKTQKEKGELHGTTPQREYAARSAAYERAGRPKGIDWTKPGSIEVPEDLKKEFKII